MVTGSPDLLGPLMVDIAAQQLSDEDRRVLSHPAVGGVILFERNYRDPDQLVALISDLKRLRSPPLLVAVDHEGGRIQRWREGFTPLPSARRVGRVYDADPGLALQLAHAVGLVTGSEVAAVGVDLVFAPVVDLDRGVSQVIGDRAFHGDPAVVTALAGALADGLREAGIAAVAKHFPGHGGVAPDTHLAAASDARAAAALFSEDVVPYRSLLPDAVDGVMTAHISYPAVDSHPAGFSSFWIREVLRQRFQFHGLVFSDDLSMVGAGETPLVQRVAGALRAGSDMVPVCNDRAGVQALLEAPAWRNSRIHAARRHRWLGPILAGRRYGVADAEYRVARGLLAQFGPPQ